MDARARKVAKQAKARERARLAAEATHRAQGYKNWNPHLSQPTPTPVPPEPARVRALAPAAPKAPSPSSSRFVRLYGAPPTHLLCMLACFALAAYTITRLLGHPSITRIAVWFVGVALLWDLLLAPLLAAADALLRRLSGPRSTRPGPTRPALINYLRAPLLVSLTLFLVWSPVILQRSEETFSRKAGLDQDPYLTRWILITLLLVALSALAWILAWLQRSHRRA